MNNNGWSVLRVWNADVLGSRKPVLETILAALEGRLESRMIAADVRFVPATQLSEPQS
jgi:very-short-patch-repair endonuclease